MCALRCRAGVRAGIWRGFGGDSVRVCAFVSADVSIPTGATAIRALSRRRRAAAEQSCRKTSPPTPPPPQPPPSRALASPASKPWHTTRCEATESGVGWLGWVGWWFGCGCFGLNVYSIVRGVLEYIHTHTPTRERTHSHLTLPVGFGGNGPNAVLVSSV